MKTTNRDKLILMILPAALIGLGWWFWFRPTTQWTELQTSVVAARAAVPTPAALETQDNKLTEMKAELSKLENEIAYDLKKWVWLSRRFHGGTDHAESTRQLMEVFRDHNLVPLTELKISRGDNSKDETLTKLATRMKKTPQELFPELQPANKSGTPAAQQAAPTNTIESDLGITEHSERMMWVVQLAGSYADVQSALEEISTSEIMVIPVRLWMEEPRSDISLRRWVLLVWM